MSNHYMKIGYTSPVIVTENTIGGSMKRSQESNK